MCRSTNDVSKMPEICIRRIERLELSPQGKLNELRLASRCAQKPRKTNSGLTDLGYQMEPLLMWVKNKRFFSVQYYL